MLYFKRFFPSKYFFLLLLLFSMAVTGSAQKIKLDSLVSAYKNKTLPDTSRSRAASKICYNLVLTGKYPEAVFYGNEALKFAQKANHVDCEAEAYASLGLAYNYKGTADSALLVLKKALSLDTNAISPAQLAAIYGNIGLAHYNIGNYGPALENDFRCLEIQEQSKNLRGQANALNNISIAYQMLHDIPRAKQYLAKSIAIKKQLPNKTNLATSLGNLAILYKGSKQYDSAAFYYNEALQLSRQAGDPNVEARTYTNMGDMYYDQKKLDTAMYCYQRSLAIRDSIHDEDGYARSAGLISTTYWAMGDFNKAVSWGEKSLALGEKTGSNDVQMHAHEYLYKAYKSLGNTQEALLHFEKMRDFEDLVRSSDNARQEARAESKYIYGKKAIADSLRHEIEINNQNEVLRSEKQSRNFFAIAGVLVLLFSAFLLQRFTVTRRQKKIIEQQKIIVEEKNQEVMDSIAYARRLQQAILPSEKSWSNFLPESFILYLPKAIVAGDFYWMEIAGEEQELLLFAAGDCTGHGVPGAMVSVVCSNALKRCVRELHLYRPNEILDTARELIIDTFEKGGQSVRDGMDISLCCLNRKTNTLLWSGANNPLWIFRKNELLEFRGDKQPVGFFEHAFPFTMQEISLQPGDWLYIITDGYGDQFGGKEGKKFKLRQLRDAIVSISGQPAVKQKQVLEEMFRNWQGKLEQVDDVTIIGVGIG